MTVHRSIQTHGPIAAKAWVARVNQAQLPPGLVRSERQPVDPPEVVEIWFAG
jgi:hypothetical protein